MTIKNYIMSVVAASFLVACGGSSSSSNVDKKDNPSDKKDNPKNKDLTKVEVNPTLVQRSISEEVSKYGEQGYNEMGDSALTSLSGNDNYVIAGSKWHNGLSVLNLKSKEIKFTPFAALKGAGHNKADASSGATEAVLEKVKFVNNLAYVNLLKENKEGKKLAGLYKLTLNENGDFTVENEQIKSDKFISNDGINITDFSVSKDGSKVLAYDGNNAILFDKDLKELASKELKVLAFDMNSNQLVMVYKKGTKVYINSLKTSDLNNLDKVDTSTTEINFEPNIAKSIGENQAILIQDEEDKAIKISLLDSNKISQAITIGEIQGSQKKNTYSVSPDNKYLAVAGNNNVYIVSLVTGKFEVVQRIATPEAGEEQEVSFISNTKLAYLNEKNDISIAEIKDTGVKLSAEELISSKLQAITKETINNDYPFVEVRKDMTLSPYKLYDSIDVSYKVGDKLSPYLANNGKFTQPNTTTTGKLQIIGKQDGKIGIREIDLTLIGKDQKNTVVINGEEIINTVTIGSDKIVVATQKGLRAYNIKDGNLEANGELVKLEGIDEIAPYGTFENTTIEKIDDTTLIGLGKKYTGKTVTMKGWEDEPDEKIKLYDAKIFKATINANGTVNPAVTFVDVGATNIKNIDLSADKKTLGVILTPSPMYTEDKENKGDYKVPNGANAFALLYDLSTNSVKTPKFEIKREKDDDSVDSIISLNKDASKVMVSESHGGIIKLYKADGTFIANDKGDNAGVLNHMGTNLIVGNKILAAPFKNSKFGVVDITGSNIDDFKYIAYPQGKAWFNKPDYMDGSIVHIPSSSRYVGGEPSIVEFDLDSNKVTKETKYKVYNTDLNFQDVDYLGTNAILSGNKNKDGYINIQKKK